MAIKTDNSYPFVNGGVFEFSIEAGATASEIFECGNFAAGALIIPSNFTTADITFKTTLDGRESTLKNLKKSDGTLITLTSVTADDHIALSPSIFAFIPFFQVISSVAQVNTVQIKVILAPVWN